MGRPTTKTDLLTAAATNYEKLILSVLQQAIMIGQ